MRTIPLIVIATILVIGVFIWILDAIFNLGITALITICGCVSRKGLVSKCLRHQNGMSIHTYSGYENKVASSIMKAVENREMHDLITEVTIPVETVREVKDGKTREVERKLFPGYVLVKMIVTDESWYLVRNTRGCTGFVSPNSNKPQPLTDEEARKWGAVSREVEEVQIGYKVGDSVRVCGGPSVRTLSALSTRSKQRQNRVRVTVPVFGRETPVELELNQVEAVDEE